MENGTKHIQKLKIILLGDSGVGKTSLINQYVFKKFQHKAILDFQEVLSKQLEIDDKSALLPIRDTNGKERYGGAGLEAAFFSDAKGCMLVYDVNDPKSFDNLENWHNEFITRVISYQSDWKLFPFIVLGNKVDVDGGRNTEVYERASKWCQSKGQLQHLLTSAKENKNVAEAFHYIAKLALNKEMIGNEEMPAHICVAVLLYRETSCACCYAEYARAMLLSKKLVLSCFSSICWQRSKNPKIRGVLGARDKL